MLYYAASMWEGQESSEELIQWTVALVHNQDDGASSGQVPVWSSLQLPQLYHQLQVKVQNILKQGIQKWELH